MAGLTLTLAPNAWTELECGRSCTVLNEKLVFTKGPSITLDLAAASFSRLEGDGIHIHVSSFKLA